VKDTVDPANRSIIRLAFTAGIPRRSFIVAVIVGAILNLINQGDCWSTQPRPIIVSSC